MVYCNLPIRRQAFIMVPVPGQDSIANTERRKEKKRGATESK